MPKTGYIYVLSTGNPQSEWASDMTAYEMFRFMEAADGHKKTGAPVKLDDMV